MATGISSSRAGSSPAIWQPRALYVGVLPVLRSHLEETGATGYFAFDVHLDTTGHQVVATALGPLLTARLAPDR